MAVNDIVMSAAGASGPATYIEDVFSTYLYNGTGDANVDLGTQYSTTASDVVKGISICKTNDASKFIIAYQAGTSFYARVASISGTAITFGSELNIANNYVSNPNGISIEWDSTYNKAYISVSNDTGNSYYLTMYILTVSGTSLSKSTAQVAVASSTYVQSEGQGHWIYYNQAQSKWMLFYVNGSLTGMWAKTFTSNGTSLTFGPDTNIGTVAGYVSPQVFYVSQYNTVYITYPSFTGSTIQLKIAPVTLSGTTFSVGTTQTIYANQGGNTYSNIPMLYDPNTNQLLVFGYDNPTSTPQVRAGTPSAGAITFGSPVTCVEGHPSAGGYDAASGKPFGLISRYSGGTYSVRVVQYKASGNVVTQEVLSGSISGASQQSAYGNTVWGYDTVNNRTLIAYKNVSTTALYARTVSLGITGSSQTIVNNIDLSTKGGMTWIKARTQPAFPSNNTLFDTVRGAGKYLISDASSAEANYPTSLSSFNSNGFSLGADPTGTVNYSGNTYASWTFREQPKFFDIVTYTGNGVAGRQIAHSLGSAPGAIIVKGTSTANAWTVYHRSLNNASGGSLYLNSTSAQDLDPTNWNSTNPTSSVFTLGSGATNTNGVTYVAYLFAHDAGGFGATGTDNVISCGSWTNDASGNATINLGYEPQYVMFKRTDNVGAWNIIDTMRSFTVGGNDNLLFANTSGAELTTYDYGSPTATGFDVAGIGPSASFIYIAIRRGPMRTPTTGTSVFAPVARTGTGTTALVTTNFVTDLSITQGRTIGTEPSWINRLTGINALFSSTTGAESTTAYGTNINPWDVMNGVELSTGPNFNGNTYGYANWEFARSPGFFDVVCYTGTSNPRTVAHNLGVVPELMIIKARTNGTAGPYGWPVYSAALGNGSTVFVNTTAAVSTVNYWNNTTPTASVFSLGTNNPVNDVADYVAYLFATVAGVSKVFSFTGNGSSQTINCSFTTGARFILIKRTDSTGDWYVWDSARGIVSGNDPHLSLNTTAAEVTTDDTIDPDSSGFIVNQVSATNVNVNGATYIGLAIA